MSNEKGGRYFREARFFFLGDKPLAQSHVPEARALLGYLRDMHAMGGPPIQVKYATLQDGTKIKATMMNGQYQAEIISVSGGSTGKSFVPTLAGHETMTESVGTKPFKWQKGTGLVYLGRLSTHDIYRVTKISDDGSMCAGYARLNGGPSQSWVVWDRDGIPTVIGAYSDYETLDIRFNEPQLFPMPPPFAEAGDYQTQRISKDKMIFLASTVNHDVIDPVLGLPTRFGTATKVILDPPSEQVLLGDTPGVDEISSASRNGKTLFFTQSRQIVHPDTSTQILEAVRKAVHNEITGAYDFDLSDVLHPALENTGNSRPFCDETGNTIATGEVEYYPYSSFSSSVVPIVYTQSTGDFFRLEQHTGDTGTVYVRSIHPRAICSDGSLIAGGFFEYAHTFAIAWKKEAGVWSRIPLLDATLLGECTATN